MSRLKGGSNGGGRARNSLVKFHLIPLVPRRPDFSLLRCLKTSLVLAPFTSDLATMSKETVGEMSEREWCEWDCRVWTATGLAALTTVVLEDDAREEVGDGDG